MRVVMLAPPPPARGPLPKLTRLLADELGALGSEVELIPWGRRSDGDSRARKLETRLKDVIRARRAASSSDGTVVVVHTAHDWSTLVRDIALVRCLPRKCVIVLHFHGSRSGKLTATGRSPFELATRALVASVDGLLVLSEEERREWRSFEPRVPVFVVRNPLPALPAAPAADPTLPPTILYVGRLMAEKGVLELVEALPGVAKQTPCRLVYVGDGPAERAVRQLTAKLGVESIVELTGHVEGQRLASFYRNAQVLALPTYWYEGFPTVILEAMSAGLPVVTTRCRGAADHLEEGVHALFVPPKDADELASALSRILTDSALRARMGAANRKAARTFEPPTVAREYLVALETVVSLSAAKRRSQGVCR